ncbi:hypothetical protein MASR2M50_05560 [Thauera sp.]
MRARGLGARRAGSSAVAVQLLTNGSRLLHDQALNAAADLRKISGMVVIPAIWRRSGQGFDSPHLHPSAFGSVLGWGCTGFDRAGKGEQATREATDVIRANP